MKIGDETLIGSYISVPSVLSEYEIERIKEIHEKEKDRQMEAKVGDGRMGEINSDIRISNVSWYNEEFIETHKCRDIVNKITNQINEINEVYFKFDLSDLEPLQCTKYDSLNQGFYSLHTDSPIWHRNITRKLSFVIQLSDMNDFEGGEFIINAGGGLSNISQEHPDDLAKGRMILFPSFLTHGVTPVTKGIRYSLVGWCVGHRFR